MRNFSLRKYVVLKTKKGRNGGGGRAAAAGAASAAGAEAGAAAVAVAVVCFRYLTLCLSHLNLYCLGRKTAFFPVGI
jgi:hypothetical protein